MKDFTVFWGCTIPARFPFLEKSVRTVFSGMNLPYRDIDGFTCCPEKSLVNNIDHGLWTLTAARNIATAEGEGLDVVSPCTGCVSNLATVKSELKTNPKKKAEVNGVFASIGKKYEGKIKLSHLVPFFHDEVGANTIKSAVKKDFRGMKFAVHYGCHMMRPGHALKSDDPLDPKKFDNLIMTLGGESIAYMTKLTCCGQGLDRVDRHENAITMARLKLRELKRLGADALILACPSCFLQFDNNQNLMEKDGEKFGIPVLYFTDLLGLAMGYDSMELGIDSHRIDAEPFLKKWAALNEAPKRSKIEEEFGGDGAFTF